MRIAVTAATGRLGGAVVKALIEHSGCPEIIGISRSPGGIDPPPIEYRKADYANKQSYLHALEGIDVVLLISGMDDPSKRIGQHQNVLEAARENGVRKIVYTSVVGNPEDAGFAPVVASNRQTEDDVKKSGLLWSIGRNGLYIEPDFEYLEHYVRAGKISNSAGVGKCGYTTREELGAAYAEMLIRDQHNGHTYNLTGPAITQQELTSLINMTYGLDLRYECLTVEAYRKERISELGEFLGTIISGIYEGIHKGYSDVPSDYEQAAGRKHVDWNTYFTRARRAAHNHR